MDFIALIYCCLIGAVWRNGGWSDYPCLVNWKTICDCPNSSAVEPPLRQGAVR